MQKNKRKKGRAGQSNAPKVNLANSLYQNRPAREAVLIVVCGDHWIEAYAEKNVDVQIVFKPHVDTPEGEIAAEQYLEANLPTRYRKLFWPGKRRAADLVRVIRPSDIARCKWEVDLLQSIKQAGAILRDDDKMEGRKIWTL